MASRFAGNFAGKKELVETVEDLENDLATQRKRLQELVTITRELMAFTEGISVTMTSSETHDVVKMVLGNYWSRVRDVAKLEYL